MDCRKWIVMVVGFCLTATGCVTQQHNGLAGSANTNTTWSPLAFLKKNDKKNPKASTCIAGGYFREREAESPKITKIQREQMLDSARRAYQQALVLEPGSTEAYIGLGRVYCNLKEYDRALATYDVALKKHPREAKLWYDLGMCHGRRKEFEKSISCFRKANELDPENRSTTSTLGLCLARAGRVDESIEVLSRLNGKAGAHFQVARMLDHLKRPDQAKQQLLFALQLNPQMRDAQMMLARMEGTAQSNQGIVNVGYQPQNQTPANYTGQINTNSYQPPSYVPGS